MNADSFKQWLAHAPKAELHMHIDGSLEPRRMLELAAKHSVALPYKDEAEVLAAYDFADLQSFLDLYYLGASVLRDADDFYALMMDYLQHCRAENIVHAEIMVEPQTYAANQVPIEVMMEGFLAAIDEARKGWDQSVALILSFLRHLPEQDALRTLALAEPYRDHFSAIGLASSELGFPPENFINLYQEARQSGYRATAHAGEEGPAENIGASIDLLQVERIDHGIRATESEALVARLRETQIPLTVCPFSNVRLKTFATLADHNVLELLDAGLNVTVNSDDPAYFGGYLTANLQGLVDAQDMSLKQGRQILENGFRASFLDEEAKQHWLTQLEASLPDEL
ncbi:MAG: adenosine deaminase [Pseudomonadota bacterium]